MQRIGRHPINGASAINPTATAGTAFALLLGLGLLVPAGAAARVTVSAGSYHTCAVMARGMVIWWGTQYRGVASPPGGRFRSVSAGGDHTCGVKATPTARRRLPAEDSGR
jgi:hypothetical protein